ncbi:MAG: lysylphosphatidylglycerol synthase transmembrane domain-containing protein [Leadbetterella sp.]
MKKVLIYVVSIGLAILMCYFTFRGIEIQDVLKYVTDVSPTWIIVSFICTVLSHVFRGMRWKVMLEPLGYNPSSWSTTSAVLTGYATNLLIPRAGELSRAASLQKMEDIPMDKSFGTVITERLLDMLCFGILFLFSIVFEFENIKNIIDQLLQKQGNEQGMPWKLYLLVIFGFLGIAAFLFRTKILVFVQRNPFIFKIYTLILGLKEGLLSVLKLKKVGQFLWLTLGIWVMYYGVTYSLLKALPIGAETSLLTAFSVLVIGTVGMAIPTQGGMGSFHLLVSMILVQHGFEKEPSLALATFQHTVNGIIYILILALAGFGYSVYKMSKKV